jgi:acetyltransferase-like isoleucine patch superfamily enzyme
MQKRFNEWKAPEFDDNGMTKWNWNCQHNKNLILGKNVDIGIFSYINAKNHVIIKDFVQIGSHCSIYSISTIDNKEGPVLLQKNSRIGSHSVIMPDVTVGKNSIIGAFSFVNRDIPENVIAYGVPVKIQRKLNAEEIKKLEEDIQ